MDHTDTPGTAGWDRRTSGLQSQAGKLERGQDPLTGLLAFSLIAVSRVRSSQTIARFLDAFRRRVVTSDLESRTPKGVGREKSLMKRIITFMVSTAMAVGLFASTAVAGGHEWHEDTSPHGHVMLVGVDEADAAAGTLTFRKCVEFKKLPTPAHHHSIHTGNAGGSPHPSVQGPLFQASNWVIPLYPYLPFPELDGCGFFSSGMDSPF